MGHGPAPGRNSGSVSSGGPLDPGHDVATCSGPRGPCPFVRTPRWLPPQARRAATPQDPSHPAELPGCVARGAGAPGSRGAVVAGAAGSRFYYRPGAAGPSAAKGAPHPLSPPPPPLPFPQPHPSPPPPPSPLIPHRETASYMRQLAPSVQVGRSSITSGLGWAYSGAKAWPPCSARGVSPMRVVGASRKPHPRHAPAVPGPRPARGGQATGPG